MYNGASPINYVDYYGYYWGEEWINTYFSPFRQLSEIRSNKNNYGLPVTNAQYDMMNAQTKYAEERLQTSRSDNEICISSELVLMSLRNDYLNASSRYARDNQQLKSASQMYYYTPVLGAGYAFSNVYLGQNAFTGQQYSGTQRLGQAGIGLVNYGASVALFYGGQHAATALRASLVPGGQVATEACKDGDCTNEVQKGFETFDQFKKVYGPAGEGQAWHHIVEQNPTNLANFGPEKIHTTTNLIQLPQGAGQIHNQISGYYSSIDPGLSTTQRVRDVVSQWSFSDQYQFGSQIVEQYSK